LTVHIICEQLGLDYDEAGVEKIATWTIQSLPLTFARCQ
jgi:hypothetical protein